MKTTLVARTLFLGAMLAVLLAIGAACMGTVHAQDTDDPRPPAFDLSIVSRVDSAPTSWDITVENNQAGDHPGMTVFRAQVEIVVTYYDGTTSETMWNISGLPLGRSVTRKIIPSFPMPPASTPVRVIARISKTIPEELPGFQDNNVTENWLLTNTLKIYTNGDTAVGVGVSDRSPEPGEDTTFIVHAANFPGGVLSFQGRQDSHVQFDVQVGISLSPGLDLALTQPPAPSGTTFNKTTRIWDVGVLGTYSQSLEVAVTLTGDSLATRPLRDRCLTAQVVRAVPWPSKRQNDTATLCLGQTKAVLAGGKMILVEFFPCIGLTTPPAPAGTR